MRFFLVFTALFSSTLSFAEFTSSQFELQTIYDRLEEKLPETKAGLTLAEAEAVLDKVKRHSVADLAKVRDYDDPLWPLTAGEIGYCFGRAMTAHLELRMAGVKRESIKKLFIAGDMTAEDPTGQSPNRVRWRFHVTTLVKDPVLNQWYSIDPVVREGGQPARAMKATDWARMARRLFDERKTSKLYLTDTSAIMVDMRTVPAAIEVENGERVIEVGFDPASRKTTIREADGRKVTSQDFERITEADGLGTLQDLEGLVWRASKNAQYKYFINRKDKIVLETPEDPAAADWEIITRFNDDRGEDFDFFGLRVLILRTNKVNGRNVPAHDFHRWYRYFTSRGDYFSELLKQTQERAVREGLLPETVLFNNLKLNQRNRI